VLFLLVAEEDVLPHEPEAAPEVPIINVPAECVTVPKSRTPAEMVSLFVIVLADAKVTPAVLFIVKLLTVAGKPAPAACASVPLYI
jgi:hypothetical protein